MSDAYWGQLNGVGEGDVILHNERKTITMKMMTKKHYEQLYGRRKAAEKENDELRSRIEELEDALRKEKEISMARRQMTKSIQAYADELHIEVGQYQARVATERETLREIRDLAFSLNPDRWKTIRATEIAHQALDKLGGDE